MESPRRGQAAIQSIAAWLIRRRVPILIACVAVAAYCAYYFNKIPRDPSVEAMVLEDDPDLVALNRFRDIFGNDEFVLLAARVKDIFDPVVMKDAENLRLELEKVDFIKEAISYTSVRTVKGTEDSILVEKLAPRIPETPEEAAAFRKRALSETDYINNFYSPDARTFSILARLDSLDKDTNSTSTRRALTTAIRGLTARDPYKKYNWAVAGVPILKNDLATTQKKESLKFEVIIFLLLSASLYMIFRTFGGMAVTLATVQGSIFVLMAAHYFSGIPLTMVSTILTPLMMIYGVSSSVHIQTHYALRAGEGLAKKEALVLAVAATMIPCMFNSTTTAIGFGSNLVSAIKPIREFAMFASGGIIMSLILSFLMIPSALSFFPIPGMATHKVNVSGLRVKVLEGIIRLVETRRREVIAICLILMGFAAWGMSEIRVETKLLEYFKPESPIRSSYDFIENNLSGISSMEIMIDTGDRGGMKDPEVLAKLEELADFLRAEKDLTSVMSLENFYKRINAALHGDDPQWRKIPQTRQEAAQFLMLYTMSGPESDLFDFVSPDYRHGRITVRLRTISSSELQDLVKRVKEKTESVFGPLKSRKVDAHVTGTAVLYANMNGQLVWGQLESFGLSLLLISIMMILVAGEIGLGLVSLLPNLMPIAITMGIMGFMGYALDSTTAMVAPVALGMAVDSTIHFMVRFRREYLASGDYMRAQAETVRLIGRAMIGTSIPLAAGFLVLTTSEFLPVFVFGLLSGIVVLLAMVFDLVLTPICMVLYRPKYKKTGLVDFFD